MHPYRWLCGADPTTYLCQAFAPAQFAGWVQSAVAFIALVGVAIGVWLTRRTLAEMRKQTQALRDQMVLTDRAWLKVSAMVVGGVRRPNAGDTALRATIQIKVENVGRSTAIEVDSTVMVLPVPVRGSIFHDQIRNWRELVENARRSSPREDDELPVARTVFPGDTTEIEWTVPIEDFEAQQYTPRDGDEAGRPCVSLYAVGCVEYRLPNDDRTRVSSFGYDLMRRIPDGEGGYRQSTRFPLDGLARGLQVGREPIPSLFTAD